MTLQLIALGLLAVWGLFLLRIVIGYVVYRRGLRRSERHTKALEIQTSVPLKELIRQAELDAEDAHRREIVTNAREDWVHGGSVIH